MMKTAFTITVSPCLTLSQLTLFLHHLDYSKSNLLWAVSKTSNGVKIHYFSISQCSYCRNWGTCCIQEYIFVYLQQTSLFAQPCFDIFHQLLITVEALWSGPILHVSKQMVAAWSKIRVVWSAIIQLPAEMPQKYLNASSCMWAHTVMEKHYNECQHSTPFVLNGRSYTIFEHFTIHLQCYCCPLLHKFHH
jgi:hypothetical protein